MISESPARASLVTSRHRWQSRRWSSLLLRSVVFLVPIIAAVLVGLLIVRALPSPANGLGVAGWWLALIGGTLLAMNVFDRLARRVLPLAWLLRMTMAFPDDAPSRMRVLLKSGTAGELRARIKKAQDLGDANLAAAAGNILALATAINSHDGTTRAHSERVQAYSDLIGRELGLADNDRDRLRWAALLHDVGKLAVPAAILNKQGKPTEAEWAIIRTHPQAGMEIAGPLVPWLGPWAQTIEHHHEWYDGSGYPYGRAGEEIAQGARIVAVADAYDTITSYRSYKKPLSAETARRELEKQAGAHFDPRVVRALFNVSLGKLRRVIGPASWLAQLPFVAGLERLGRDAAVLAATVVAFLALFIGGVIAAPLVGAEEATGPVSQMTGDSSAVSGSNGVQPAPSEGSYLPAVVDDSATTLEDEPVVISVLRNDGIGGEAAPTVEVNEQPGSGMATVDGPGVVYAPRSDFNGEDSFSYQVCIGEGRCSVAAVTIFVMAVNDPPVTADDTVAVPGSGAITFSPLENDHDPDIEELVLGPALTATGGTVVVGQNQTLTFSRSAGFTGKATVAYEACDAAGMCTPGRATLVVADRVAVSPTTAPPPTTVATPPKPANRPPTLADGAVSVNEDLTISWPLRAGDQDGDQISCVQLAAPAHGRALVATDCSSVTYTPTPDFVGTDTFTVQAGDGSGFTIATMTVTVVPLEDPPLAIEDLVSAPVGAGVHIDVAANDIDPDGGALIVTSVSVPLHGLAVVNTSGTVTYTPATGFSGLDSFTYEVCDTGGWCATGLVTVTVG